GRPGAGRDSAPSAARDAPSRHSNRGGRRGTDHCRQPARTPARGMGDDGHRGRARGDRGGGAHPARGAGRRLRDFKESGRRPRPRSRPVRSPGRGVPDRRADRRRV
ncbi:MAG: hypothetical protein AVDCRST_MAG73-264, partial [uncultured Thermomicrobiales bacterium]